MTRKTTKRQRTWILLCGLVLALLMISQWVKAQGSISAEFYGLENNKGKVIFMLFNAENGFPGGVEKAYRSVRVKVKDQQASASFEDLPLGQYALSAVHDENNNGEIDRNWMGMPKEKVGMSGEPGGGRPSYEKAVFILSEAEATRQIAFEPFTPFGK